MRYVLFIGITLIVFSSCKESPPCYKDRTGDHKVNYDGIDSLYFETDVKNLIQIQTETDINHKREQLIIEDFRLMSNKYIKKS